MISDHASKRKTTSNAKSAPGTGREATIEHEAQAQAIREKTERLKALRLAKEH
jgi:hypothetical protein